MGHDIVEASDGMEAWNKIQQSPVQCVITDWMMPSMDGLEVVGRIRAAEFPRYIYVILLTAKTDIDDVIKGLESGVDDYLVKPFNARELRARVGIAARIVELEQSLREARDEMGVLATRDGLTGLLNRRTIMEHLAAELNRATREQEYLGLALLDLDHFKTINDRYGHLKGDDALRLVANSLNDSVRPYDWVGRWGGEEFLIILPRANPEQALAIAERVRERIAHSPLILADGSSTTLGASIGAVVVQPTVLTTVDDLLHHADEALYQAKREGRDRVQLAVAVP